MDRRKDLGSASNSNDRPNFSWEKFDMDKFFRDTDAASRILREEKREDGKV